MLLSHLISVGTDTGSRLSGCASPVRSLAAALGSVHTKESAAAIRSGPIAEDIAAATDHASTRISLQ